MIIDPVPNLEGFAAAGWWCQHKAMVSHKVDSRSRTIQEALYNDMDSHNVQNRRI